MKNLPALYLVTILFIIALLLAAYELNDNINRTNELAQSELAYMNLNQSYANLLSRYSMLSSSSNSSGTLSSLYNNLSTPALSSIYLNQEVKLAAATQNSTGLHTGFQVLNFTEQYPGYLHFSYAANMTNVTALIERNGTYNGTLFQEPNNFSAARKPYYWLVPSQGASGANITVFLLPGKYVISMQNFNTEPASASVSAEYASFNVK